MRFMYLGIGAAAFIALIVGIVLFSGTKPVNVAALNSAASTAGCGSIQTFANQGQKHVAQGTIVSYNSDPPTSGSHYQVVTGVIPAPTGVHTAPIQNEVQVHNLEHGHIGIQYTSALPTSVLNALETFARNHDTYVFLAPRPNLPSGVQLAFSRWQTLVDCASPTNADAVVAFAQKFYDAYHGLGPEGGIPGTPIS
jgi:hypothetical protein